MGIPAANTISAANVSGTFGKLTTSGTKKANATVPEFLSYTRRGNPKGAAGFAAIPEDFDWSIPQEPKTEGNKLDLTEGQ